MVPLPLIGDPNVQFTFLWIIVKNHLCLNLLKNLQKRYEAPKKRGTPLKGQHLFVRPVEADDESPVRQFFAAEGTTTPDPLYGPATLMAKLAGTIVAHASAEAVGSDLHIRAFYVSSALRGKRIGRGLLLRLIELAARMHCLRVVAPAESSCDWFFKRNGFVDDGGLLTIAVTPSQRAATGR